MLKLLLLLGVWANQVPALETEAADNTGGGPALPDVTDSAPIINGESATIDDYPMTGGLLWGVEGFIGSWGFEEMALMCSSTLIAPDVVLMAAHCLDTDYFSAYIGYYGGEFTVTDMGWSREADLSAHALDFVLTDWPTDTVYASDWVLHPDWDMSALGIGLSENFDIALMFLQEPVLDIPHAYLITADEVSQIDVNDDVEIVGWGQQTSDSQPPAGTYGTKQMAESYIAELAAYELQIGLLEDDSRKCHGDSGGPTFLHVESASTESMRQIGITSHAYDMSDCEKGGVDTRVDYYLDWIDDEMRSRCEDGTRSWCEEYGIVPPPMPVIDTGDTGLVSDTGSPAAESEEDGSSGCGCQVGSLGAVVGLFALLPTLAIIRRQGA